MYLKVNGTYILLYFFDMIVIRYSIKKAETAICYGGLATRGLRYICYSKICNSSLFSFNLGKNTKSDD